MPLRWVSLFFLSWSIWREWWPVKFSHVVISLELRSSLKRFLTSRGMSSRILLPDKFNSSKKVRVPGTMNASNEVIRLFDRFKWVKYFMQDTLDTDVSQFLLRFITRKCLYSSRMSNNSRIFFFSQFKWTYAWFLPELIFPIHSNPDFSTLTVYSRCTLRGG